MDRSNIDCLELDLKPDDIYFIVNKNILKDRLQIASAFHIDGSIWVRDKKSIELINILDIKIKLIIPILSTNADLDVSTNFIINYDIKDNSLKNIDCEHIIIIYSKDINSIRVGGVNNKVIQFKPNKLLESKSHNITSTIDSNNEEYSFYEDNKEVLMLDQTPKVEDLSEKDIVIENTFIDTYKIDSSKQKLYHTININDYSNCIGSFMMTFIELTSFINKISNSKVNKIRFEYIEVQRKKKHTLTQNEGLLSPEQCEGSRRPEQSEGSQMTRDTEGTQRLEEKNTKFVKMISSNNITQNVNIMKLTLINSTEIFEQFEIDNKNLEKLKGINVAITNNKKKDKKIYNQIIFDIIKKNDKIIGISIRPNNIPETNSHNSSGCFFIFIPVKH